MSSRRSFTERRALRVCAVVAALLSGAPAAAQSCPAKAVDKDGKRLSFSGLYVFFRRCIEEDCRTKAVDQDGKPLTGAAREAFLKKCGNGY